MEESVYVLTKAYNDYDQHGEYLVTVYIAAPSVEDLCKTLKCSKSLAKHILTGGGRQGIEDIWFYLSELETGKLYEHKN